MYVGYGNPNDAEGDIDCPTGVGGSGAAGGGFYTFYPNTCNVQIHWLARHSPMTGNRYALEGIFILRGELPSCRGDIAQQVLDMAEAFSYDGKTLALYEDDGTPTSHSLPNNLSSLVDGPRVTRISYPRGDRGEWADHRTYFIEVRALYDYGNPCDLVSGIIEYHERLRYVGAGGNEWASRYDQSSTYRTWQGDVLTPVRLIQSGYSKGWGGWVLPLPAVAPSYLHSPQIIEDWGSPSSGSVLGKEYTLRWVYPMTLPSYVLYTPTTKV